MKFWNLNQANQSLPLIKKITQDLMDTWKKVLRTQSGVNQLQYCDKIGKTETETLAILVERLEGLYLKMHDFIAELDALNCFVEEFKRGIINFPAIHNGSKVFLTWSPEDETVCRVKQFDQTHDESVPV